MSDQEIADLLRDCGFAMERAQVALVAFVDRKYASKVERDFNRLTEVRAGIAAALGRPAAAARANRQVEEQRVLVDPYPDSLPLCWSCEGVIAEGEGHSKAGWYVHHLCPVPDVGGD